MIDIVIAHYDEDLSWISKLDLNRFIPRVVSKTKKDAFLYTPINKGYEASAYLEYIIANYDRLSEYTLFVQGAELAWHHEGNLSDIINKLEYTAPYYNFNSWGTDNDPVCKANYPDLLQYFIKDGVHQHIGLNKLLEIWDYLFEPLSFPQDADWSFKMCAQFYVHRDCILKHSKSIYETMLHRIYSYVGCYPSKHLACCFEWAWHFIFTGNSNEADLYRPHQLGGTMST